MSLEESTELVLKAKKRDEDAFYELIQRYKGQLYRMALAYLKNEEEAVDAVQEVTFRAYKKIKKLKDPALFQTWLIRILINYCHDEWKRKKRVVPVSVETSLDTKKATRTDRVDHAAKMALYDEVNALKTEYKDVIILKYFEDYKIETVAEILNKPEGTVKTWLRRALRELRGHMKEEDIYG